MTQQKLDKSLVRTIPIAWLLVAASLSLSGCGLMRETHHVADLARRTTFLEPRFYDYIRSDKVAQREARLLAEQAWGEVSTNVPNASPDYQNGFTEGFADFLYRGGEGEPPVIPPRGYWNLRFLNQFGRLSVNDWYEGFRHGVQVCKASGLRSMWLVPTSLLGGLEEEDALPNREDQLWSADPDLTMNQMMRDTEPTETLTRPEAPPVPTPDNSLDEDSTNSSSSNSSSSDVSSSDSEPSDNDERDLPSPEDDSPIGSGTTTNDNSDVFGIDAPTETDPLETDPLEDVLAAPEPSTPDAEKIEDDIFGAPEGTFDSSESFEVDDLDFNFEDSSYSPKPKGPLSIRKVSPVARIPSYLENSQNSVSATSGQYDDDIPLPPQSLLIGSPNNVAPIPPKQANPLPLSIGQKKSRTTVAAQAAPNRIRRQQIGESLTVTDMLMTAEPIAEKPTAPAVTMWLDDDAPAMPTKPDAPAMKDEVNWEPFKADNSTGFRPAQESTQRNADVSFDEDFGALNYEDILDERSMQRSTQWTPQREKELPLRVGKSTKIANPYLTKPKAPRMQLRAESEPTPRVADLRMHAPSKANELPKIYVRPQSSGIASPIVPSGELTNDTIEESALRWRDRN